MSKKLLVAVSVVVALLLSAVVAASLFLDANRFRPELASMMSNALGRQVTIGNLRVAWLSGGVAADDVVIADDPAFSRDPFVSAKSVSIGVDLMPLIVSRSLRVQSFTLDRPAVTLLRSASGTWNFSSLGGGSSSSSGTVGAISVLVQKIRISGGQVVVGGLDGRRMRHSYEGVDASVSDLSFTSRFPFSVSAKAPGGGSLIVEGEAGPFNMTNVADTPFHGTVTIKRLDLASTGLIDPASGIAGVLDFSGTLSSDGTAISTKGKASVVELRLLAGASASRVPVAIDYESIYNSKSQAGRLKQLDVHVGKALATMTGDYRTSGSATSVEMTFRGADMPVTELEAALPAIGVTLPSGAVLTQGVLNTTLSVSGAVDHLTIAGPLKVSGAKLTGFDLGAKLGTIAALTGVSRVGDTVIETLGGTLRMTPEGIHAESLEMFVPAIGTLTGDGTITPKGAMDFAMLAKLAEGVSADPGVPLPGGLSRGLSRAVSYSQTSGVPFRIQGTTSNPAFVPDVSRAVKSATTSLKDAAKDPDNLKKAADALSGLFGR